MFLKQQDSAPLTTADQQLNSWAPHVQQGPTAQEYSWLNHQRTEISSYPKSTHESLVE